MPADIFYNVAGWLAIALAVAAVRYFVRSGLAAKFRKDFHDAFDEAGGPPESPA
jgi:hypothetical protein